ncbi:PAS domain-containing sensor histidine kinase [Nisaea nitritireducens]|uniref:PAS domain-containing sensor histidine kinase n=1 Tax=Nisaea nitritireducens TaxID=568392 RepID=UPI0018692759|nr:PAS domain-containing protein [Nisaea nitritireducens]
MAISLHTAALSAMLASLLLAAALTYLRSIPNAPSGLSWWAGGFWAYAGANGCVAFIAPEPASIFLEILLAMSAVMLAAGTRRFLGYAVLAQLVVLGISLIVFWVLAAEIFQLPPLVRAVPVFILAVGGLIFSGLSLWRKSGTGSIGAGYRITGVLFVFWGLLQLDYPILRDVEWIAPYGFLLAQVLAIACAIGLMIIAHHKMIARAETEAAARHAADDALLLQLDLRQHIIDAVPMPIFVEDDNGLLVNANSAFAQLTGCNQPDVAGKNIDEIWSDAGIVQALEPENAAGPEGMIQPVSMVLALPSGQARSYAVSKMSLAMPGESRSGSVVVMQDMTDRNRTEMQLHESEKRFRDFAEASSDWLWETDAEGRFSYFAHGARDYSGLIPESNLGRTRFEATIEDLTSEKWRTHISDIEAQRPFSGFRYLLRGEEGHEVAVMINGMPFYDDDGTFLGYRGTGSDVTRQREAEISRDRALLDAERANRAKSEFLATMSHEFRTPLNAILGFSEMLSQEVLGPVGAPAYREYADAINDSGNHMLALVNDILDISAIEAGKRVIMKEEIGLLELLRESTVEVSKIAADKSINLEVGVPGEPLRLFADLRSVRQIILNLLSNAVKFTPESGWIRLSAQSDRGDMIAIVVEDSGEGIAADKLPTITDPFSQASNHPHHSHEGTGLGLSIVKSLVDAHSGELRIESTLGVGTKVTVWLHAALGPKPALQETTSAGPKVDIEEDSDDI